MYQDVDYTVTIKYPYLEYHNTYKNVIVTRPLITSDDFKLFFKSAILLTVDWPMYALKCFTSYTQFNLLISGKRLTQGSSPVHLAKKFESVNESTDSKPNTPTSKYTLDCKTGCLVVETDSSDVLKDSKIDATSRQTIASASKELLSQTELSGFIEKDEAIGKIEIKGFVLSIVGLSSEFDQKIPFTLAEWRTMLTNIKYYTEPLKIMIGNYKASQEERISKRKLFKVLQKYEKYAEKKLKNTDLGDILSQKSTSKIVKKIAKHEKDSKRYLFEITLPKVSVSYMHHEIETQLTSDDVEHL